MKKKKATLPRIRIPAKASIDKTHDLLKSLNLHTVCQEAGCPNRWECFSDNTATFLILGDICTRNCKFCGVTTGTPPPPDPGEPERIAEAAEKLGLKYVVVTTVTRDDLPDGGAEQFVKIICAIRKKIPNAGIEVLTSDFDGNVEALEKVLSEKPAVFNHNVETVERLTPLLRSKASYLRSLAVLNHAAKFAPDIPTKSGLMVGVGETEEEVRKTLEDLRKVNCKIITIGQYLAPSENHYPVVEFIPEETFELYKKIAEELGFSAVASGALVRSSYHASQCYEKAVN